MTLPIPAASIAALLVFAPAAFGQGYTETFTNGTNEGDWEVWWVNHNSIEPTGGNPGWYLRLDNLAGPATCHWVEIFMNTWPSAYSGDYRALGLDVLGLDVNIVQGAYGGEWFVTLASDPGTPQDDSDDCMVKYFSLQVPPLAPGWTSYEFGIPVDSTTMPNAWVAEQSCGLSDDALWNAVITDVDYIVFRLDTDPTTFCQFTTWDLGVDNIRVGASDVGTPYCFGDGSGGSCPCGNSASAGEGCGNSTGAGGLLGGYGSDSAGSDSLVFQAQQLIPLQPALLFAGLNAVNGGNGIPFGDGLRCAGQSVVRLGVDVPDANGDASWGPGLGANGGWGAGATRYFQGWYRDPNGGPCGSGFNLTNGVVVVFGP
jgi:hypothetical protein